MFAPAELTKADISILFHQIIMLAPAELTKVDISILFPSEWRLTVLERKNEELEDKNEELEDKNKELNDEVKELRTMKDQLRRANLELEEYRNKIRNSTSQDTNKNRELLQMFIRNF